MPRLHLLPSRISKLPRTPRQQRGGTPPSRTHAYGARGHVQSPPFSKNSPSTKKLFENPAHSGFHDLFLKYTVMSPHPFELKEV